MSYQAVSWALDIPGLRPPIKLVLVALAERADAGGGSCYPGISELTRRASTSRRRVIEAIRELEAIGAIRVRRSAAVTGRRRDVNQYQLAVGQTITVASKASGSATKKGTILVPRGNQYGSPGYTVTSTEPPLNPHSDTYVSARILPNARNEAVQNSPTTLFPDKAMVEAAQTAGVDPEALSDIIADYRGDLLEESKAGNAKAQKQYRTLWFSVLSGKTPDLESKL